MKISIENNGTSYYNNGGNIIVHFKNSDGSGIGGGLLFNEMAVNYTGSTSYHVKRTDTYILQVDSEPGSKWEIQIN